MATSQFIQFPEEGGGGGSGVSSLNGLTGALTLLAGSGISITPSGADITIAATDSNIYALLAGRAGGQNLHGGTAPTDALTLTSTSNGTNSGPVTIGWPSSFILGDTAPAGLAFYQGFGLTGFDFYYSTDAGASYTTQEGGLWFESISSSATTPVVLNFGKARGGSYGSLTYNNNGDRLAVLSFNSFQGNAPFDNETASIRVVANENQSGGAQGSKMVFSVTPNTTTSETAIMQISGTGLAVSDGFTLATGNFVQSSGTIQTSSLTTGGLVQSNTSGVLSNYTQQPPTTTILSTPGSGTYTHPAGLLYIEVEVIGAGGGGQGTGTSGGGAGTSGTDTVFNTINCGGGVAGGTGGTGGSGGGGLLSIAGNPGGGGGGTSNYGGNGGGAVFGGAGMGGNNAPSDGTAASANSGSGGGGGGGTATIQAGIGGGAGGYTFTTFNAPFSPISYTVGTGGTGGAAGASGANGGAGAGGLIKIIEYYQ